MHRQITHLAQIDYSVVKAVFHFLNSDAKNIVAVSPFNNNLPHLQHKIESNFIPRMRPEIQNVLFANWTNIESVDFFITQNFQQYEQQLYAILEKIHSYFKTVPSNNKGIVDFPVNDPVYFDELSYLIIPEGKKNDPRYMLTAKAMVLFLFKHGEFGRKTPDDPPTIFPKLS